MIPAYLEKLFGKNWQTKFWGSLCMISVAINQAPTVISFLPDTVETWIRGVSGFVMTLAGIKFAFAVKSKNVTGIQGVNAQTKDELTK